MLFFYGMKSRAARLHSKRSGGCDFNLLAIYQHLLGADIFLLTPLICLRFSTPAKIMCDAALYPYFQKT